MSITKNIFVRLLDNRLTHNNIKLVQSIDTSTKKENLINKIITYVFLPIFVSILAGLMIFYIQRQDLITSKKMESFEYIVKQLNNLSSDRYNQMENMNFMYSSYLNILNNSKDKSTEYIKMDFARLKLKSITNDKKREVKTKVIINNIRMHTNLLKVYYGFSIDDTILPIEKMIAIVKFNMKTEQTLNTQFYSIMDQVKEFYSHKPSEKEKKSFDIKFNKAVNELINGESSKKALRVTTDLKKSYLDEFNIFQNMIYKTYEKEFEFFNFGNSKNEFNSIIAKPQENLHFNIVLNKDGKFILKN